MNNDTQRAREIAETFLSMSPQLTNFVFNPVGASKVLVLAQSYLQLSAERDELVGKVKAMEKVVQAARGYAFGQLESWQNLRASIEQLDAASEREET